jgi:hypothetical protein
VPTAAQVQQVAPGVSVALVGQFQNVVGTPGDDWIHGGSANNVLDGGGTGNDTLIGGSGPATLVAGSGNDSLVAGSGGTTFLFNGDITGNVTIDPPAGPTNLLDFSAFGGPVNLNLGSTAAQPLGNGLTLTLQAPQAINALADSAYADNITGNGAGDRFYVGPGNDTFSGQGGDSYFFAGSQLGNVTINEAGIGSDLNFYGFGAGIHLDLSKSGTQVLSQAAGGSLALTLSNPSAFSAVVGTPYADDIIGGAAANTTIIGGGGGDSLVGGSGGTFLQGKVTQVVYLQFPAAGQTPAGEHVYTADEQAAILLGLQQDYADFNYFFTLDPAAARQHANLSGGKYATLTFDAGGGGGAASELDPGNLDLGGTALINVNPFLGDPGQGLVPPTSANIVGLTTTIAAHELGHLSGLQHQDAIGPVGTGIPPGVKLSQFFPGFTGPRNAVETARDIMASPDSVGSTLLDAAGVNGPTYFGARDDIKLAFNDTGTVLSQQSLSQEAVSLHGGPSDLSKAYYLPSAGAPSQPLTLPSLAVPNTLPPTARDSGKTFNVTALAVNGTLATKTQEDFYAFTGHAGQVMTFQVISNDDTLNPHPIIPELVLVGPDGKVLAYNVHEFESADSTLLDVTLPTDGTYYVGVDSLLGLTAGNYRLFMYSFATSTAPSSAGGDTLVGGNGSSTMVGSSGNDLFTFLPGASGTAFIQGGSGQSVVDLSLSPNVKVTATGGVTIQGPKASPTTTTLAAPVTLSGYGQALALTAAVAATSGAAPTGTVDFKDTTTGQDFGSAPVVSSGGTNQASLTVTGLAAGAHTIEAFYTSDNAGSFANSNSTGLSAVVSPATATVSVSDGGMYNGAALAATATVTGISGTPGASLEGLSPIVLYYASRSAVGTPMSAVPTEAGTYTVLAVFPGTTNYLPASARLTFTIAPAALAVSGVTADTKMYDSTRTANLHLGGAALVGVFGHDDVTLNTAGSAGTFDTKDVGSGKTVAVSGLTLTGAKAGDYALTQPTTTAGITPATLTASGVTANAKAYDGTTAASLNLSGAGLVGVYGGDTANLVTSAAAGTFASKDVGRAIAVTVSGLGLGGAQAGDYQLTQPTTAADITAASPAFSGLGASQSIVYGVASVGLSGTLKAGSLVPPGSVTITAGGATTTAPVGSGGSFSATLTTSSLPASATPYAITYSYHDTADRDFADAQDASTSLTVNKDGMTTTVTSPTASTVPFGQKVTLTATVTANAPGSGTPSGNVDFFDTTTGNDLGPAQLSGGVATLATANLAAVSQTITTTYLGDPNFLTSARTMVVTPVSSVYVLNTTVSAALSLSGNGNLTLPGLLMVDSKSATAVTVSGNAQVKAGSVQVVGGVSTSGNAQVSPKPTTGAAATTDPLAGLAVPSVSGSSLGTVSVGGNSSRTINPGVYTQISVSGNGKLTMNPGVYVIAGSGFSVSGNASVVTGTVPSSVTGSGVLIYNAGSNYLGSGSSFGAVTFSGNATVNLSAPTTGTYAGIVLFQSRDNVQTLSLNGNTSLGGGAIYAPAALLSVSGNGMNHTPLIVNELQVSGNGAVAAAQVTGGSSGAAAASSGMAQAAAATSDGVAFVAAPQALVGGQASGAITVQLQDVNGNPVAAGSGGVTLTLSSTSANGTFLDTTGQPLAGAALTIPEGQSTASFEYLDTSVGFPTLTAAGPGVSGTQRQTVTAGSAVYSPAQVRTGYGVNSLALDGTGQTIAIVDAYDDPGIFTSLDAFDSLFGAAAGGPTLYQQYGPASSFLTVLGQDGGATLPPTDPSGAGTINWETETALDVEWAHAVAPGARVVLVEANSQSLGDLMTAVQTAAGLPGVSVVSMSWGFVEGRDVLAQDEAQYDSYLTTPAGHQGVTFVASTGDYGAAVPQYPAFSPNVVAVGGTSLHLNGDSSYNSESGWGALNGGSGQFIGGGGGLSQYEAEPTYQQGVQSTGFRTTPDVSFLADPATGAWVADSYNLGSSAPWEIAGGTSLAAPAWAGLLTLANQGRVAAGQATLGTAGPTETQAALYGLSRSDFHDITSGSNGYSAGPGYDLVTGLGSPVADRLVPDLAASSGGPAAPDAVAPIAASGLTLGAGTGSPADAPGQGAGLKAFAARVVVRTVDGGRWTVDSGAASSPSTVHRPPCRGRPSASSRPCRSGSYRGAFHRRAAGDVDGRRPDPAPRARGPGHRHDPGLGQQPHGRRSHPGR